MKPRYEQKLIRSTFKDTTKAQGVLDVANADTSTSKGNKKKNIKKLPPCINSFYIQIIWAIKIMRNKNMLNIEEFLIYSMQPLLV